MSQKLSLPKASDISAGFFVALVGIPQCLAYAMLSGLPPMYGLVTAAIPGIIAAIFGKCSAVTVGPTNTTGLIILTSLSPWASQPDLLLTAMATLACLAGFARLVIVLFRAERIFDFVPEAVMVGFATGAALIIALMQIDELLGPPFKQVRNVSNELVLLFHFNWHLFSLPSFALGIIALLSVVLGRKYAPKWPIPLLVLLFSIFIVWLNLTSFSQQWVTLGDSTIVSDGWPIINQSLPSLSMVQALIIPGFAVAFIGSLELIVTLRNRHEHQYLRTELSSQGVANVVGSFVGAFPASTSLTRSVLLDISGAQTRWAPLIAALVMIPIILFGAEGIRHIPQPVISGLLIATAISMLKPAAIKQILTANAQTRSLFLVTLFSTLILNFHEAILLGAATGIVLFLFQASRTNLFCYYVNHDGQLKETSATDTTNRPHLLIQVSGSLYFAAARQLPNRLEKLITNSTQHITIDLSHAHQCRIAAVQALFEFSELCTYKDIKIELTGASQELKALTHKMGVRLPWSKQVMRMSLTTMNAD